MNISDWGLRRDIEKFEKKRKRATAAVDMFEKGQLNTTFNLPSFVESSDDFAKLRLNKWCYDIHIRIQVTFRTGRANTGSRKCQEGAAMSDFQ